MQWPVVAVGDVRDAYGFVARAIKKSGVRTFDQDEYEELMCAGIVVLLELYERYDANRDGGKTAPRTGGGRKGVKSFAGYASYLLPLQLRDAWHRAHPTHVLYKQEDGTKKYVYYDPPASLSELTGRGSSGSRGDARDGERSGDLDERSIRRVGDFVPVPIPS